MSALPEEKSLTEGSHDSFWMPGKHVHTVRRTNDTYHACDLVVACFRERARVERHYAQQLTQWSSKWKPLVDASPLYGSLLRAWQCFLTSADRLSDLHSSICRSLVSEDGDCVRTWQKETFHKKMCGGFKESQDLETGFAQAQKPWLKRLKKLEKACCTYHKACDKEQAARKRATHAQGNPDVPMEKQKRAQEESELASQQVHKARAHYEKVLEEVTRYTPRYMEEMESVFDQSQEDERKRISFLKQAFLSIYRHLNITDNESVKAVYNELHHSIMSIDEQDDLRWWRSTHGPDMATHWPRFQEWNPEPQLETGEIQEDRRRTAQQRSFHCQYISIMIGGVRVRALFDFVGQEADELSFKAGEEFLKVEDEDDQGWCKGVTESGNEGFYPANYVEILQ